MIQTKDVIFEAFDKLVESCRAADRASHGKGINIILYDYLLKKARMRPHVDNELVNRVVVAYNGALVVLLRKGIQWTKDNKKNDLPVNWIKQEMENYKSLVENHLNKQNNVAG